MNLKTLTEQRADKQNEMEKLLNGNYPYLDIIDAYYKDIKKPILKYYNLNTIF